MKLVGFFLVAYLACVLQATWSARLAIGAGAPHFLALTLVAVLVIFKGPSALVWAAVIGLLGDCLSSQPLGIGMVCSVVVLFSMQPMTQGRKPQSCGLLPMLLLSFLMIFLTLTASTILRALSTQHAFHASELLITTAATATYSTLVGNVVLIGWRFLNSLFHRRRANEPAAWSNRWPMISPNR